MNFLALIIHGGLVEQSNAEKNNPVGWLPVWLDGCLLGLTVQEAKTCYCKNNHPTFTATALVLLGGQSEGSAPAFPTLCWDFMKFIDDTLLFADRTFNM